MNPADLNRTADGAPPAADASLAGIAQNTTDYVKAWSTLFAAETRVARTSAVRLMFAAAALPAVILGVLIAADALVAALAERLLHDWASGIALTLFLDVAAFGGLLVAMRRWWRNLSLPRSRAAFARLVGRMT
ncbi:MAG TPA: hypothetical protein VFB32_01170 [Rudaea sp.]|nr:hypothetical protein [Rudaea sp.]